MRRTVQGAAGEPRRAAVSTGAGVVVSLTALIVAAPAPPAAVAVLADAGASSEPTAPLVAVVALLAWAVSGWLALTVVLLLLSRLPGLLGSAARVLAARLAPATVRRAVEAALGLTVAVGALAPSAAVATTVPGPASPAVTGSDVEVAWDLDWPSSSAASPRVVAPSASPTRSPTAAPTAATEPPAPPRAAPATAAPSKAAPPKAAPPAVPRPAAEPRSAPVRPPAAPADLPTVVRPAPAGSGPATVVVRPGDNLWSLAEDALRRSGVEPTDRQVAQAWPRWWAANREAIGDDPDLLLPGTALHPPTLGGGSA